MHLTLEGIVLRQYRADEDRILHILTAQHGVITAFANGANKMRSALAASTELLCYSTFVLFSSRGRYVVDKADSARIFFGIRSDIVKLALASYLAQLADEVCPHGVEAQGQLRLLLNTLHCIEADKYPPAQLKALFELRLLTLSGFMPDLVACRSCGSYEHVLMHFYPQSGDLLCESCREAGEPAGDSALPVGRGVLAAMRHIIYAQPEKLFSFSLSEEGLATLGRVAEAYLHCQVEKTFSALEFYRGL